MSSNRGLMRWAFVAEFVLEICLAVVAFLAVNDVYYPDPFAWVISESVVFVVNLGLWLVTAFCCSPAGGRRGSSLFRADAIYFVMTTVMHFLLAGSWITYALKSLGLAPLTWADNPAAFAVFRSLFVLHAGLFAMLTSFTVFDLRYARIKRTVSKKVSVERTE